MEPNKLWIVKLQDYLRAHIYSGLRKTLYDIKEVCGGRNLKPSVQVTMEGIPYLGTNVLNEDFNVFKKKLYDIGLNEDDFNEIIRKAYQATALSALKDAGLRCEGFDPEYISGPVGKEFIHQVYINTGRSIWYDPDILINERSSNGTVINTIIDEGISKSVCDGIDLNKLIKDMKRGRKTISTVQPKEYPKTTTQRINNGKAKCILESDSDDSGDELEQAKNILDKSSVSKCEMPPRPVLDDDEETVDDEMLAPDNATIASETDDEMFIPVTLDQKSKSSSVLRAKTVTNIDLDDINVMDIETASKKANPKAEPKAIPKTNPQAIPQAEANPKTPSQRDGRIAVHVKPKSMPNPLPNSRRSDDSVIHVTLEDSEHTIRSTKPPIRKPQVIEDLEELETTEEGEEGEDRMAEHEDDDADIVTIRSVIKEPEVDLDDLGPGFEVVPKPSKGPIYRVELVTYDKELSDRKSLLK